MNDSIKRIEDGIKGISEPHASACMRILNVLREPPLLHAQGSSHNHQWWQGGYLDHVAEVMDIACVLYRSLSDVRRLPFNLSDALLILFLHDLEKPWKYGMEIPIAKSENHEFRLAKLLEYGIELDEEQHNALKYVEGEHVDYTSGKRTMNPLAAFCHMCDVCSARIWYDQPTRIKKGVSIRSTDVGPEGQ